MAIFCSPKFFSCPPLFPPQNFEEDLSGPDKIPEKIKYSGAMDFYALKLCSTSKKSSGKCSFTDTPCTGYPMTTKWIWTRPYTNLVFIYIQHWMPIYLGTHIATMEWELTVYWGTPSSWSICRFIQVLILPTQLLCAPTLTISAFREAALPVIRGLQPPVGSRLL